MGLAENNTMLDNKRFGVSIGHNDTDNLVRNNEVLAQRQDRHLPASGARPDLFPKPQSYRSQPGNR